MKSLSALAAVLGGGLLMTSCASRADPGFADVERDVADRSHLRVHWNQGTADDEQIRQAVAGMLAKVLGADDAVQIALLNNRFLQGTYVDLGIAQADLIRAGALRNPVLSADARFFSGGVVTVELSLLQNLLDLLSLPRRKRLAAAALAGAKLSVTNAVLGLAHDVRVSFYRLQGATQLLEMRRTIVQASAAADDLARRLREAGNITVVDAAQEHAMYEQAKLDLAAAEVDVATQREELNIQMGLWGTDSASWRSRERLPDLPAEELSLTDVEKQAVAASIRLSLARGAISADAQRLGIATPLALAGDTDVGVSAAREIDGSWGIGPAIAVPLPIFNQGQGVWTAAHMQLRRSEALYVAQAIEVRAQARIARARLSSARDRVAYLRTVMLPLRHLILVETQKQYNGMLASPFQLIVVKQQEVEAGAQFVQSLRDYWIARSVLAQVLAGGDVRGSSPEFSQPMVGATVEGAHR